MKAKEFHEFGQSLNGLLQGIFPGALSKPEPQKQAPQQPAEPPQQGQPPQNPNMGRAVPKPGDPNYEGATPFNDMDPSGFNTGTPVQDEAVKRVEQRNQQKSPTGGQSNMPAGYSAPSEYGLSKEYGFDPRIVDKIVQKYVKEGYAPEYAIGMAANAIVESNLVPTALNKSEGAHGLFQWRHDRLENLDAFADRAGKTINDINSQIDFSIHELRTTERSNYDRIMGQNPQSAEEYARLIDQYYERSSGEHRDRRASIAGELWSTYFGEGGRAKHDQFLSFSEDSVPVGDDMNAKSRDQILFDMMMEQQGKGDEGLDFGDFAGQQEQGQMPIENPLVEFSTGQTVPNDSQTAQQPSTVDMAMDAETTGKDAGTQSPAGGQDLEIGNSRNQAGTGGMRSGLGDIFGRRPDETDASFRDRRRNIFLNAAEGFQMLSRGVKADFNTPTQMRLDETQRRIDSYYRDAEQVRMQGNSDRNYELAQRQEARLQRSQEFEEQKFIMQEAAAQADLQRDSEMRANVAGVLEEQGYGDLATLAQNGQATKAIDLYQAREEAKSGTGDFAQYTITDNMAEAAALKAERLGEKEMANAMRDSKGAPRGRYDTYNKIMGLDESNADGYVPFEQNEAAQATYNDLMATMPEGLTASQQQQFRGYARMAAMEPDATTRDTFYEAGIDIATQDTVIDKIIASRVESLNTRYDEKVGPGIDLADAGVQTMGLAANPDFDPNALKGSLLTPFASYLRGIPGGSEMAEKFLGVDTADKFASTLLTSIKNKQLGNLSKGIAGQLSNEEGKKLLAAIGDGKNERAEIMALGQLIAQGVKKDIAELDARKEYLVEAERTGHFSDTEMGERANLARQATPVFKMADSVDAVLDMQKQTVLKYAEDQGLTDEELDNLSFNELPDELRGTVIRVIRPDGGEEYLPMFLNQFDEYKDKFDENGELK